MMVRGRIPKYSTATKLLIDAFFDGASTGAGFRPLNPSSESSGPVERSSKSCFFLGRGRRNAGSLHDVVRGWAALEDVESKGEFSSGSDIVSVSGFARCRESVSMIFEVYVANGPMEVEGYGKQNR